MEIWSKIRSWKAIFWAKMRSKSVRVVLGVKGGYLKKTILYLSTGSISDHCTDLHGFNTKKLSVKQIN